jgi:hypothetical protein
MKAAGDGYADFADRRLTWMAKGAVSRRQECLPLRPKVHAITNGGPAKLDTKLLIFGQKTKIGCVRGHSRRGVM